jgi:predicted lipoprotein with Yx(FWY)xxD motif
MTKHITPIRAVGAALAALVLGSTSAVALGASAHHPTARTTVAAAHSAKLHQTILVTPRSGRTLYRLQRETTHHIMCTGTCAKVWPPLLVPSRHTPLRAGAGVHVRLSIVRRPDGKFQVAASGKPLYTFADDRRRGDVRGQDFQGFFVVPAKNPAVTPPRPGTPAPTMTTTPPAAPAPSNGY